MGPLVETHRLDGTTLTLSEALLGPALHHPAEPVQPLPPLDRWRRAAGAVLESSVLLAEAERVGAVPVDDWVWRGLALFQVERVAPALDLASPEIAQAVVSGDLGRHPRAGVAVMEAWEILGVEPIARARQVLEGSPVSASEWLRLGQLVLDLARGPARRLPVLVGRPPERDVPCTLSPWSWGLLQVPAHQRGGFVAVEGPGTVAEPWAESGRILKTMAAATVADCSLRPESGGPVGRWSVASAQAFGQVLGARGVGFHFKSSGRCEVLLADAFVGPLASLDVGERVGTSGVVPAQWSVAGPWALRFRDVRTSHLTLHDRAADRFAVPARGFGLGEWLEALQEAPWAWQRAGDRLVLRGRMFGGDVEVRLRPEG